MDKEEKMRILLEEILKELEAIQKNRLWIRKFGGILTFPKFLEMLGFDTPANFFYSERN